MRSLLIIFYVDIKRKTRIKFFFEVNIIVPQDVIKSQQINTSKLKRNEGEKQLTSLHLSNERHGGFVLSDWGEYRYQKRWCQSGENLLKKIKM